MALHILYESNIGDKISKILKISDLTGYCISCVGIFIITLCYKQIKWHQFFSFLITS